MKPIDKLQHLVKSKKGSSVAKLFTDIREELQAKDELLARVETRWRKELEIQERTHARCIENARVTIAKLGSIVANMDTLLAAPIYVSLSKETSTMKLQDVIDRAYHLLVELSGHADGAQEYRLGALVADLETLREEL